MLEYDILDVREDIDINKTDDSHECITDTFEKKNVSSICMR